MQASGREVQHQALGGRAAAAAVAAAAATKLAGPSHRGALCCANPAPQTLTRSMSLSTGASGSPPGCLKLKMSSSTSVGSSGAGERIMACRVRNEVAPTADRQPGGHRLLALWRRRRRRHSVAASEARRPTDLCTCLHSSDHMYGGRWSPMKGGPRRQLRAVSQPSHLRSLRPIPSAEAVLPSCFLLICCSLFCTLMTCRHGGTDGGALSPV